VWGFGPILTRERDCLAVTAVVVAVVIGTVVITLTITIGVAAIAIAVVTTVVVTVTIVAGIAVSVVVTGITVVPADVSANIPAIVFDMTPQVRDLTIEALHIAPIAAIRFTVTPDTEIFEFTLVTANIGDVTTHMVVLRLSRNEAYQSTQNGNEAQSRSETNGIVHGVLSYVFTVSAV
jgi:hypothetical protein